jgi:hypothetical protein
MPVFGDELPLRMVLSILRMLKVALAPRSERNHPNFLPSLLMKIQHVF